MTQKIPAVVQFLQKNDEVITAQLAAALPDNTLTVERMKRITMTEMNKNKELLNTDPKSLVGAMVQAAQLGLEPGGALGQCYILPYKNRHRGVTEAQLIIGYKGMLTLARRSGQILSLTAHVVHEGDEFDYELGLRPDLHHKPALDCHDKKLTFVYAVAVLKGGGTQFEVMSAGEIARFQKPNGPWRDHFEAMAKKTVIRRLFNLLPVSSEMQMAIGLDSMADTDGAPVSQGNHLIIDLEDGEYEAVPAENGALDKGVEGMKQKITQE